LGAFGKEWFMRKYGLFLVSAALVAVPAAAQTYGSGFGVGVSAGSPASTVGYISTAGGGAGAAGGPASYRSFFNADGPTQLAAHKARWARIEAKRQQRALEKAQQKD
jgi:hypothetical protein